MLSDISPRKNYVFCIWVRLSKKLRNQFTKFLGILKFSLSCSTKLRVIIYKYGNFTLIFQKSLSEDSSGVVFLK